MTYLHFGGRCLLALVFAASAVSKLRGPGAFRLHREIRDREYERQ